MPMAEPKRTFPSKLGHWAAELLLVFLGAYAAFWLTGYQQHQQEARRRDQILESLEQNTKGTIANSQEEGAKQDKRVAEFRRALDAGEMPPLRPITFSSDYNANDAATLLQSGGLEVLDVKTILALRAAESAIRGGLSRLAHLEKLSDQLIVPNLDADTSFFYDPATKQLRKRFQQYPDALQAEADWFHNLARAETELLHQIQAERKKDW
jgi:hypothetical protein